MVIFFKVPSFVRSLGGYLQQKKHYAIVLD